MFLWKWLSFVLYILCYINAWKLIVVCFRFFKALKFYQYVCLTSVWLCDILYQCNTLFFRFLGWSIWCGQHEVWVDIFTSLFTVFRICNSKSTTDLWLHSYSEFMNSIHITLFWVFQLIKKNLIFTL